MKVYIVFGDVPRSDGENIKEIFSTLSNAEAFIEKFSQYDDTEYWHIEEFTVEK